MVDMLSENVLNMLNVLFLSTDHQEIGPVIVIVYIVCIIPLTLISLWIRRKIYSGIDHVILALTGGLFKKQWDGSNDELKKLAPVLERTMKLWFSEFKLDEGDSLCCGNFYWNHYLCRIEFDREVVENWDGKGRPRPTPALTTVLKATLFKNLKEENCADFSVRWDKNPWSQEYTVKVISNNEQLQELIKSNNVILENAFMPESRRDEAGHLDWSMDTVELIQGELIVTQYCHLMNEKIMKECFERFTKLIQEICSVYSELIKNNQSYQNNQNNQDNQHNQINQINQNNQGLAKVGREEDSSRDAGELDWDDWFYGEHSSDGQNNRHDQMNN